MIHLRQAELERSAARNQRESSYPSRAGQIARAVRYRRPAFRLRPATRQA